MRQFAAFVKKEFRHILRDRWTTIILLVLPIVMLLLFGFAITTEVRNTGVAVYDPSGDQMTRAIVERLAADEHFKVDRFLSGADEIEPAFKGADIGLVVAFSGRFAEDYARTGEAQILLVADGSDPNTATTLVSYARGVIASYQAELAAAAGPGAVAAFRIATQTRLLYNPLLKGAYNFVPGVMGMILMLICAMMTSISIAREKESGSMELLLASPMRPLLIILAKAVPYFCLSVVNLATILLLSVFVLDVPVAGSLFALVLLSLVFIFLSLSIGLLVSSAVSTQAAALLVSGMAFMLPVMLLSGMIFPVDNMPAFLRALSAAVPARWYILAVRKLMIKGLGLASVTRELAILGGMTIVVLAASLKRFKVRLE
jgi:ABC-2 type transport system permease protein